MDKGINDVCVTSVVDVDDPGRARTADPVNASDDDRPPERADDDLRLEFVQSAKHAERGSRGIHACAGEVGRNR